jgi:hypothetical protein
MFYNIESTYSFILELRLPIILDGIILTHGPAALPGIIAFITDYPLNLL